MTLRDGLVYSKNTITAQVMQDVGLQPIVKLAKDLGIRQSKLSPVPSLALGTSPVTLLEMTNAYATLAALGERHAPLLITQIVDTQGRVMESFDSPPERVLDQPLIEKLVDVMRGVITSGTGTAIRSEFGVKGDLAGKTGTTQNNTDGWFIMMNPRLVAGAWVGFNDARVTIRSNYWGQGGHNALRLVGAFFQQGQKAKLIDTQATFPQVEPDTPPPMMDTVPSAPPVGDAIDASAGVAAVPTPLRIPAIVQTPAATAVDRQLQDQARGR
jgi:penicillin-binding protein 1A